MVAGQPVHAPKPSPEEIVAHLRRGLGDALEYAFIDHDRVVCRVHKDAWLDAVRFVREDPALGCTFFSWLSAIDWTQVELADAEAEPATESSVEDDSSDSSGMSNPQGVDNSASEGAVGSENSTSPSTVAPSREDTSDSATKSGGESSHEKGLVAPQPDSRGIVSYYQPAGELFEVCCHLSAPQRGFGITLKTAVDKENPTIPSLVPAIKGADWHERECHEMFGIVFEGHPNLAKLYLPEEFEGHPLRKSYLLGARVVKPWPGLVDVEEIPPELEPQLDAVARGKNEE